MAGAARRPHPRTVSKPDGATLGATPRCGTVGQWDTGLQVLLTWGTWGTGALGAVLLAAQEPEDGTVSSTWCGGTLFVWPTARERPSQAAAETTISSPVTRAGLVGVGGRVPGRQGPGRPGGQLMCFSLGQRTTDPEWLSLPSLAIRLSYHGLTSGNVASAVTETVKSSPAYRVESHFSPSGFRLNKS